MAEVQPLIKVRPVQPGARPNILLRKVTSAPAVRTVTETIATKPLQLVGQQKAVEKSVEMQSNTRGDKPFIEDDRVQKIAAEITMQSAARGNMQPFDTSERARHELEIIAAGTPTSLPVETTTTPTAIPAGREQTTTPAPKETKSVHWTESWGIKGLSETDTQILDRLLGSAVNTFYRRRDIMGLLSTAVLRSPSGMAVLESVAGYMNRSGISVPAELTQFLTRPEVQTAIASHEQRLQSAAQAAGILTNEEVAQLGIPDAKANLFPTIQKNIEQAIKKRTTVPLQNFLKHAHLLGKDFQLNIPGILHSAGTLPSDPVEQQQTLAVFAKQWEKMVPLTVKERIKSVIGKTGSILMILFLLLQGIQMVDQITQSSGSPQH